MTDIRALSLDRKRVMTLSQAQAWLRENIDVGAKCPCCDQFAKRYRRKLNSGIARALIAMYRAGGTEWVHKPTVLKGLGAAARDESIARYWGLIQEETELRPDGGRAGWWRVTYSGELFVRGELTVHQYALIYDARCLGLEGPQIDIEDALGDKFSWEELMRS